MGEAKRVREATARATTVTYTKPRACPNCEVETPHRVIDDRRHCWVAVCCGNCTYRFSVNKDERDKYAV